MQVATPVIANRYIVRRQLGQGGQGEVYEVTDSHEGDVVALKLLTSIRAGTPWVEAQILRRLADPHILPIRNADVASGRPYIVTELARHGTVEDRLVQAGACGLEVDEVIRLVRQACHGVARGHDLRLLHNDIKPGNLFLNAQGECLVGDFGFASMLPVGHTTTAPAGATPETTAPEVAGGWPAPTTASIRSDVYSLGATAYWMLAGQPPVDVSAAPDFAGKMAIVATATPARLRDVAPHVPNFVAVAVERRHGGCASRPLRLGHRLRRRPWAPAGGDPAVAPYRRACRAYRVLARRARGGRQHICALPRAGGSSKPSSDHDAPPHQRQARERWRPNNADPDLGAVRPKRDERPELTSGRGCRR